MTFTDYLLNGLLIAIVVFQLRGRRITTASITLPVGVVAFAAVEYLHGIPTAGNDLLLALAGAVIGLVLGTCCGLATNVYRTPDGTSRLKATPLAALLWVVGVGARLSFSLYSTHGGGRAIERFSTAHHITSTEAWVACVLLMALAEVISRTAVIAAKYFALDGDRSVSGHQSRVERAMMELRGRWS